MSNKICYINAMRTIVLVILFMLLLPSCEEKQEQKREQECDVICEAKRIDFELLTNSVSFRNEGRC